MDGRHRLLFSVLPKSKPISFLFWVETSSWGSVPNPHSQTFSPLNHKAEDSPHDKTFERRSRCAITITKNQIQIDISPNSAAAYRLRKWGIVAKKKYWTAIYPRSRILRGQARDWSKSPWASTPGLIRGGAFAFTMKYTIIANRTAKTQDSY